MLTLARLPLALAAYSVVLMERAQLTSWRPLDKFPLLKCFLSQLYHAYCYLERFEVLRIKLLVYNHDESES